MCTAARSGYIVSRSVGVYGSGVHVRQIRRGNVTFGGGHGWGDAELGPRSQAPRSSAPGAATTGRCRIRFLSIALLADQFCHAEQPLRSGFRSAASTR
jgi:hypothetical protein